MNSVEKAFNNCLSLTKKSIEEEMFSLAHVSSNKTTSKSICNKTFKNDSNFRFNLLVDGKTHSASSILQYCVKEDDSPDQKLNNVRKLWTSNKKKLKIDIMDTIFNLSSSSLENKNNPLTSHTKDPNVFLAKGGFRVLPLKSGINILSEEYRKLGTCFSVGILQTEVDFSSSTIDKCLESLDLLPSKSYMKYEVSNIDSISSKETKSPQKFKSPQRTKIQNKRPILTTTDKKGKINTFKPLKSKGKGIIKKLFPRYPVYRSKKHFNQYPNRGNRGKKNNRKRRNLASWKPRANKNHPERMQKFRPQFIPLDKTMKDKDRVEITFNNIKKSNLKMNGIELAILYRKVKSAETKITILQKEEVKNLGKISILNYIEILLKSPSLQIKIMVMNTLSGFIQETLSIEQQAKVARLLNPNIVK